MIVTVDVPVCAVVAVVEHVTLFDVTQPNGAQLELAWVDVYSAYVVTPPADAADAVVLR